MAKKGEKPKFESEAALVAAFCAWVDRHNANRNTVDARKWTAYHETAGWDLLLVNKVTGAQIGIEAKLALNPKVLTQALPSTCWSSESGPDFRAVLVPADDLQGYVAVLAKHLGIVVIRADFEDWRRRSGEAPWNFRPELPDESWEWSRRDWPDWLPAQRCKLPDYVPDVVGGHAAPVALTTWKIAAIKLLILLDRRGYVTRKDISALKMSPTRWCDHWNGFLGRDVEKGGYVRCGRTPDLKAQHPINYAQIEADFDKWGLVLLGGDAGAQPLLT